MKEWNHHHGQRFVELLWSLTMDPSIVRILVVPFLWLDKMWCSQAP